MRSAKILTLGREYYLRAATRLRAKEHLERVAEKAPTFAERVQHASAIIRTTGSANSRARNVRSEQALKINPSYSEASLNLAVLYNDLGKYNEAREIYNHTLHLATHRQGEMDPFIAGKLANMHADTGDAYLSAGLHAQAVEEFQQSLGAAPELRRHSHQARRGTARCR